jgi:hypothetical protein
MFDSVIDLVVWCRRIIISLRNDKIALAFICVILNFNNFGCQSNSTQQGFEIIGHTIIKIGMNRKIIVIILK